MRYKKRKTANGSSDAGSSKKKPRQGQYVLLNPNRQLSDDSDSGASNQLVKLYEDDSNNASDEKNEWSSSSVDSSDYSFHESDCESVISEEFSRNVWSDSSNDSDYNPGIEDVEDIIVSAGDAILHDAGDINFIYFFKVTI